MGNNFSGCNITPYSYSTPYHNIVHNPNDSYSSNLRVVNPDPGDEKASAVCAIAVVSGVSYAKAWNTALTNGFRNGEGMYWQEIMGTLNDLGVNYNFHKEAPTWNDLPDLAMISVRNKSGDLMAVVFERRSGGSEKIYDSRKRNPVAPEGYVLVRSDGYLELSSASAHPSFPSSSSSASSFPRLSSSNLRIVRGDYGDGGNCAVCAIAVASGVSYEKAWNTAVDHGFHRNDGMDYKQIEATLDDLKVKHNRYGRAGSWGWNDLPDLAIITVRPSGGGYHAVVFERRADGREYIYDNHHNYPVRREGYNLIKDSGYIRIHKGGAGSYA